MVSITEPGVFDLDAATYHNDPVAGGSLSSSGARKLLAPSCPAAFKAWRDGGQQRREAFDVGRAAHAEVLGTGDPIAVIDADDWRGKAARAARDEAYAAGYTPLLSDQAAAVQAMAEAIRADPDAGPLLAAGEGLTEQTLVWHNDETGVTCRAMVDRIAEAWPGDPLTIIDLKTTTCAEPGAIGRSVEKYGYHQQAAWYLDGVRALGLDGGLPADFVFVFVEKTPPHLVTTCRLDTEALAWGFTLNRKARDIYRQCTETGRWPGYADQIVTVGLPSYARHQLGAAADRGAYEIEPRWDAA